MKEEEKGEERGEGGTEQVIERVGRRSVALGESLGLERVSASDKP